MSIGLAALIWIATTVVVIALFALSSRGRTEFWTLCCGLVVLAILLGFTVATPPPRTVDAVAPPILAPTPSADSRVTSTIEPPSPTQSGTATALQLPSPSTTIPSPTRVVPTISPTLAASLATETIAPVADTSTAVPATRAPESVFDTVTVNSFGANVRSAPELGDNLIGQVFQGDELLVVQDENDWLLVRLGANVSPQSNIAGDQGWISSGLVDAP